MSSAGGTCDHGAPVETVTLGRGCAQCLARAHGAGDDALWWGRQIERHAARAAEAARERAALRARLVDVAAHWRRLSAELRAQAAEVIPFGQRFGQELSNEPSEADAAKLDGRALQLDACAAELERLAEEG